MAKKEGRVMVCPKSETCDNPACTHRGEHIENQACQNYYDGCCVACIPLEEWNRRKIVKDLFKEKVWTFDVPEEVREAARKVTDFFSTNFMTGWAYGDIESRGYGASVSKELTVKIELLEGRLKESERLRLDMQEQRNVVTDERNKLKEAVNKNYGYAKQMEQERNEARTNLERVRDERNTLEEKVERLEAEMCAMMNTNKLNERNTPLYVSYISYAGRYTPVFYKTEDQQIVERYLLDLPSINREQVDRANRFEDEAKDLQYENDRLKTFQVKEIGEMKEKIGRLEGELRVERAKTALYDGIIHEHMKTIEDLKKRIVAPHQILQAKAWEEVFQLCEELGRGTDWGKSGVDGVCDFIRDLKARADVCAMFVHKNLYTPDGKIDVMVPVVDVKAFDLFRTESGYEIDKVIRLKKEIDDLKQKLDHAVRVANERPVQAIYAVPQQFFTKPEPVSKQKEKMKGGQGEKRPYLLIKILFGGKETVKEKFEKWVRSHHDGGGDARGHGLPVVEAAYKAGYVQAKTEE